MIHISLYAVCHWGDSLVASLRLCAFLFGFIFFLMVPFHASETAFGHMDLAIASFGAVTFQSVPNPRMEVPKIVSSILVLQL